MTDTQLSRIGGINLAAGAAPNFSEANFALFLKKFAGEVLLQYHKRTVFGTRHRQRMLGAGAKSAQFPVIGTASASYHKPGENLLDPANGYLSEIKSAEKVISIDHVLQSSRVIAEIDELISHFDVRGPYAMELGKALAEAFDGNVARQIIKAARSAETITGSEVGGGFNVTDANLATANAAGATALETALWTAAETFETKNQDPTEAVCVVAPDHYYNFLKEKPVYVDRDFTDSNGGLDSGRIARVAGIPIVKSTNMPTANEGTGVGGTAPALDPTAQRNVYQDDFSVTKGVIFRPDAVGTVKRMDLTMEGEYRIELQGHLMVAKQLTGTGVLRPEAACELRTAAPEAQA